MCANVFTQSLLELHVLLRYLAPANIFRGDVPGPLLDPSHQGELDVWPLVDGHGHGDQVQDKNGKPLDEESLGRTDQDIIGTSPRVQL